MIWQWTSDVLRPVGDVVYRSVVPVSYSTSPEDIPIISKITFGGELVITIPEERRGYKGKLFVARTGQLIYSKIRLKQGSFCIIPPECEWIAVSNEYPVYEIDESKILRVYFDLVLRCNSFQKVLNRLAHGGGTKTRIHPEQFENIVIPVPSVDLQRSIVKKWTDAQMEIERLERLAKEEEQEILRNFLDKLGLLNVKEIHYRKVFAMPWSTVERWSFEYNTRMTNGDNDSPSGKYPIMPVSEIFSGTSGGTPSKRNHDFWIGNIPWVSPKDMKSRRIFQTIDTINESAIQSSSAPLIPKGSILVVVRSGILQRNVPVAINDIDVSINQDMRAFIPKTQDVMVEYVLAYLEAQQNQLLKLVKWSTTVQSINKDELEGFLIPIPPKNIQFELVNMVETGRKRISGLLETARNLKFKTDIEIEAAIMGNQ